MKKLFFLLIPCILLLGSCSEEKNKHAQLMPYNVSAKSDAIPFLFSQEEIDELDKCNISTTGLIDIALNGNRAALYKLGIGFIKGKYGLRRNPQYGAWLIARSASLGFAPAFMYRALQSNDFIKTIYLNVAISAGHTELVPLFNSTKSRIMDTIVKEVEKKCQECYSDLRSDYQKIVQEFINTQIYQPIEQEIKRISTHKQARIFLNQKKLKRFDNIDRFIFFIELITDEDVLFDAQFIANTMGNNNPKDLDIWIKDNQKIIHEKTRFDEECLMIFTFILMRDFGLKRQSN